MAYIDRTKNRNRYPYKGTFYMKGEPSEGVNGSMFDEDAGDVKDVIILERNCDIQERSHMLTSGAITTGYDVFIPLGKGENIIVDRGYMFKGDMNGLNVSGMVISVGHSNLGGAHFYVQCSEI